MNSKQVWFVLSLATVTALTLVTGVLEGRIRNRWGPSETMLAAAKKLEDVPTKFGGPDNDRWQLQSSDPMSDNTLEILECTGYLQRTYANPRTGDVVSVFVIVGPAGPIAVHTPEICFSSQDYKTRDTRQPVVIADPKGQDDQFWALTFKTKSVPEDLLRIYYAWGTGNRWSAANDARFAFAGWPYLYKIQLASRLPAGTDLKTDDTCQKFLKDFVPVMRQYLVEPLRQ
ncbi:MAG: exosortase-associated EpsI family protein [Thermoguttaceae bacterium]|jgi:hypothetical protein